MSSRYSRGYYLLLCAVWAVASAPCVAQMKQCDKVAGGVNYKVLVDEVHAATARGDEPVLPVELIQSSVEGALKKLRQGILNGTATPSDVWYLDCKGRHPEGEADFNPGLVRYMAANHAILELWGTLFSLGDNQYEFKIYYVMFPIASLTTPPPSGYAYTTKPMSSKPTTLQVLGFFTKTRADLPMYFSVAMGAQAYADHDWSGAVRFLCEARTRLKSRNGEGDPTNYKDLMNYSDALAAKAAAEIQKANGIAVLLTDAQRKNYCAFATTR